MEAPLAANPRPLTPRGFYRLRLARAGPSYAGRQSRNSRRLERQLEDRWRTLSALWVDLGFFSQSEPFLTRYDPAARALQP